MKVYETVGQIFAILSLAGFGAIGGAFVVWTKMRHRPTNRDFNFLNKLLRKRDDDLHKLCHDILTSVQSASALSAIIDGENRTESTDKLLHLLDDLIITISERDQQKSLTPFDPIT